MCYMILYQNVPFDECYDIPRQLTEHQYETSQEKYLCYGLMRPRSTNSEKVILRTIENQFKKSGDIFITLEVQRTYRHKVTNFSFGIQNSGFKCKWEFLTFKIELGQEMTCGGVTPVLF